MNSALHHPDRATATLSHRPVIVQVTSKATLTPVESALTQLFILKDFKSTGMNTYKKPLGGYPIRQTDVALASTLPTEHQSRSTGHIS